MRVAKAVVISLAFLIIIPLAASCNITGNGKPVQQQVQVIRGDLTLKSGGAGTISVDTDAKPSFGNGGKVIKLNVKEGEKVAKGTVLAQLETDDLELVLAQSKATLSQAKVSLIQAQSNQTQAEVAVNSAQFNLDKTKAVSDIKDRITDDQLAIKNIEVNMKQAQATGDSGAATAWNQNMASYQNDLTRQQNKLAKLLSQAPYTATDAAIYINDQKYDRITVEDIRAKQLQVEAAQKALDLTKQQIEQTQAAVDEANKAIAVNQKQINDATIISPIDGVVATVNIKEGDTVVSSSISPTTPIYIIDTYSLYVDAQIHENKISGLSLGQRAIISLDAIPGSQYEGKVTFIGLAPTTDPRNNGVVSYEVKIGFANPIPEVKLGMNASVQVVVAQKTGVLLIPARAIKQDNQGQSIVDKPTNSKVTEQVVKTGISDGVNTEIISGLSQGETVLIP